MSVATLRRSAIANATRRRTLSIDLSTSSPDTSPRLDGNYSLQPNHMQRSDQPSSDMGGDMWDEARVGLLEHENAQGSYRPAQLVKLGVATIRRRSRRAIFFIASIITIVTWLSIRSHPLLSDMASVSDLVKGNSPSLEADSRGFHLRVMDCLSFKECPWLFGDVEATRAQTIATDEEYLEPEHLALPRKEEPYPILEDWSIEKKEKALRGLDWLITHYDQRWRPEPDLKAARRFNQEVFIRLQDCIRTSMTPTKLKAAKHFNGGQKPLTCSPEEMTVVLLGTYHFGAVHIGWVSGEDIWARSVMATIDDLGYSSLYAYDTAEIFDIYWAIPDLIPIVIAQTSNIRECNNHGVYERSKVLSEPEIRQGAQIAFIQAQAGDSHEVRNHTLSEWSKLEDDGQVGRWKNPVFYGHPRLYGQHASEEPDALDKDSPNYEPHAEWRCAQTPDFPQGIPLWKMFGFHFWENTNEHPLGPQWTLAPEPYRTFPSLRQPDFNMYLGYSIEAYCGDVIPIAEREHRAYILAKIPEYFEPPRYAFSNHVFSDMKRDFGYDFAAGIGKAGSALPDSGIINIGFMTLPEFRRQLGRSKVLIGVGRPRLSPTPYDGLCMGLPFINSILDWDKNKPDDQSQWYTQHEGLINVGEPYVYNVRQGNETQFKTAIAKAFENSIGRFIPRRMSQPAMRARHRFLVEADWKAVYDEKFGGQQV